VILEVNSCFISFADWHKTCKNVGRDSYGIGTLDTLKGGVIMRSPLFGKKLSSLRKEVDNSMRLSTVLFAVVVLLFAGMVTAGTLDDLIQNPPPGTHWDANGKFFVLDKPIALELPRSPLLNADKDTVSFENDTMYVLYAEQDNYFALTKMPTPKCEIGTWMLTATLVACLNYPEMDPDSGRVVVYDHLFGETCRQAQTSPKGDSIGHIVGYQWFTGLPYDWENLPAATWTQVDFDNPVAISDSVFFLAWDYWPAPAYGPSFYTFGYYRNWPPVTHDDSLRFFEYYGWDCPSLNINYGAWMIRAVGHCMEGQLIIVEDALNGSYVPPLPVWAAPGEIALPFHVTAIGDQKDVLFESTDLVNTANAQLRIASSNISFDPSMFQVVANGETVDATGNVSIPVGTPAGTYAGMFKGRSLVSGKMDTVLVTVEVGAYPDMDIDDHDGNLSGNIMYLEALPNQVVGGTFVMINPNCVDNNMDLFDGPGNINLPAGVAAYSDLVSIDQASIIPGSAVSMYDIEYPSLFPLRTLTYGTARHIGLSIDVPKTTRPTTYEGDVTVSIKVYSAAHDSIITIWDKFGINLDVQGREGSLDVVPEELSASYTPPAQWAQDGLVEVGFQVSAAGDVHNVKLYSEDLVNQDLGIKIAGDAVNFTPEEIGEVPSGQTVNVKARIPVTIGRRTGTYVGKFNVVADGGASADVNMALTVESAGDLDVQDYAGSLVGNNMVLTGIGGGIAVGRYTVANPNLPDNNVDLADGPGNDDITELAAVPSALSIFQAGEGKCKGVKELCVQYVGGGGGGGEKCGGVVMVSFKYHNLGHGNLDNVTMSSKGNVYFTGPVNDGDVITADARTKGLEKLGTETYMIWCVPWSDTTRADNCHTKVHTSCSQPIEIGMTWGDGTYSWEIVDIVKLPRENGGGGGGTPTSPAWIEVRSNKKTYFADSVEYGDTICVDAGTNSKLGVETEYYINGYLNVSIHTSCSQPIEPGMVKGAFIITKVVKFGSDIGSIPSANVNGNITGASAIISGAAEDLLLQVSIPDKAIKNYDPTQNFTYFGTVTVQGKTVNGSQSVSDVFNIELRIVKGGAVPYGFWGSPGSSGNLLYWSDFGLKETGYAVYRCLDGSFVKLADLSVGDRSYVDEETRSGLTYEYKLGVKIGGSEIMIGPLGIRASDRVPNRFFLSEGVPNPTTGATTFRYTLASESNVSIRIYNIAGQMVESLTNKKMIAGVYAANWDCSKYSNGVYFCKIIASPTDGVAKTFSGSRKIVVLR
jgi:hypothetical protein